MKKAELEMTYFQEYHQGKDQEKISFVLQLVKGLGVFDVLFDNSNKAVMSRLTDSPDSPVRLRLDPLLLPGTDKPMYVGSGPTADIRIEHLEMATLGGTGNTLLAGRTLFRMAENIKAIHTRLTQLFCNVLIPMVNTHQVPTRKTF